MGQACDCTRTHPYAPCLKRTCSISHKTLHGVFPHCLWLIDFCTADNDNKAISHRRISIKKIYFVLSIYFYVVIFEEKVTR